MASVVYQRQTMHIGYNHYRVGTKTLLLHPRGENKFSIQPQDLRDEVTLVWHCGNDWFLSYQRFFTIFGEFVKFHET